MHSTSVGDLSTLCKRYLRMVFGFDGAINIGFRMKNKTRSGQISVTNLEHTQTHTWQPRIFTSREKWANLEWIGWKEIKEEKKYPNERRQTEKLFLAVWLWVKARIRSSASLECFVVLNKRERTASRYTDEHAGRQKTLVSDAASSSEREPPRCLSLFVEVMSKISHSSPCLGGVGAKNAQLETTTKFLFLLDAKLLSLHLCVEKTRCKTIQREKWRKKSSFLGRSINKYIKQ